MRFLRDSPRLWLPLALLVEAVFTLVDISWGPWSGVGFEEGRNARAALQLACGHSDRLLDLQYRDFCGGCTADAVLGAPLFFFAGDTIWVWKLVPASFHLLLVGAVAGMVRLARPAVRHGAPVLAVAVLAASPWSLRELALTGWGNHAEVRGIVMASALLLLLRSKHGAIEALTTLLAGVLGGLAVWYAHIAVHAVPALLLLAALRKLKGLPFLVGLPLGMLPWWLFVSTRPTAAQGAEAMWGGLSVAPLKDTLHYVFSPLLGGQWWPHGWTALSAVTVGTAVLGALWGIFNGARTGARRASCFGLLALGGFLAAVWLRGDLWTDVPVDPGYAPFHLRYRAVLWPLVALGLGVWASHPSTGRRAWLVATPLLAMGLGWRVYAWTSGPAPGLFRSVWTTPGRPDATVPEGQPARRRAWGLDRPVDVAAAQQFADTHADRLLACRSDHLGELGRRAGLQAARGQTPALALTPDSDTVAGVAWALTRQGRSLEQVAAVTHLPLAWQVPVRTQMVRLVPEPQALIDLPGAQRGLCLGLADQAWQSTTSGGRHLPADRPAAPSGCAGVQWDAALAHVRQEHHLCTETLPWPDCP